MSSGDANPSSLLAVASAVSDGHDYETQEDWDDESETQPSQLYPYTYPSGSKGGSSDEDEDEDEDEPHYEQVSTMPICIYNIQVFLDYCNESFFPSFFCRQNLCFTTIRRHQLTIAYCFFFYYFL